MIHIGLKQRQGLLENPVINRTDTSVKSQTTESDENQERNS